MSTYEDLEKRVAALERENIVLKSRIVRLVSTVEESLDPPRTHRLLRVRVDPRAEPIAQEAQKDLRSASASAQGLARVLGLEPEKERDE